MTKIFKTPKKYRDSMKRWRLNNKEKIKRDRKEYNKLHRKEHAQTCKTWKEANSEVILKHKRKHYQRNKNNPRVIFIRNIRQETRRKHHKTGVCEKCNKKAKTQFHHPEPYRANVFEELCVRCHNLTHDKGLLYWEEQ